MASCTVVRLEWLVGSNVLIVAAGLIYFDDIDIYLEIYYRIIFDI